MSSTFGLLLAVGLAAAGTAADHLFAGARHFRDARYTEALTEFREAQRLGAADAQGYAAATLVKLGRHEEALELFESDTRRDGDALLQYYRAVACFETRMYLSADAQLAGIKQVSGPHVAGQVMQLRVLIAAELQKQPSENAIDWQLDRCETHRAAGRRALAAMYCREAAGLASRRFDRYGRARAEDGLAQLDNRSAREGGRP